MKLTLYKYIFSEIWPTFLVTLFVSIFIIISVEMLSLTELIVNRGVGAGHMAKMVLFLLPDITAFALPAASLISVVVAFLRFSADSEIIALKSSGLSIYQMLPPVVTLGLAGMLLSIFVGIFAVPWGNSSFKDLAFRIAESKADLAIKDRVFCEPFDDITFYVSNFLPKKRMMEDVFMVDKREKGATTTIVAQKGRLLSRPEHRSITLHFLNGTIFMVGEDLESARALKFRTYDLTIKLEDIMSALAEREKDPKEMTVNELLGKIRETPETEPEYNEMLMELLEKFSMPLAVFLMAIIGVPLGAQMKPRGRSTAVGISLLVFLVYSVFLAAMRSVCETGILTPLIGMWLPSIFLLVCCLYLLKMSARERSLDLPEGLTRILKFAVSQGLKSVRKEEPVHGEGRRGQAEAEGSAKQEQLKAYLNETPGDSVHSQNQEGGMFMGNLRMRKFHRVKCMCLGRISGDNLCLFNSREEAVAKGFSPCKICKP